MQSNLFMPVQCLFMEKLKMNLLKKIILEIHYHVMDIKLASENYLRVFSKVLPYVSMRMFNVTDPTRSQNLKQGMVSIYVAQALKNKNICVRGELNRFRDFIYIDDVVEVLFKAR